MFLLWSLYIFYDILSDQIYQRVICLLISGFCIIFGYSIGSKSVQNISSSTLQCLAETTILQKVNFFTFSKIIKKFILSNNVISVC